MNYFNEVSSLYIYIYSSVKTALIFTSNKARASERERKAIYREPAGLLLLSYYWHHQGSYICL